LNDWIVRRGRRTKTTQLLMVDTKLHSSYARILSLDLSEKTREKKKLIFSAEIIYFLCTKLRMISMIRKWRRGDISSR
jgi:hypothetical protein